MKKKIMIGSVVLCLVLAGGIGYVFWVRQTAEQTPTDSTFSQIITTQYPAMLDTQTPLFTVKQVKRIDTSWYVVTIQNTANSDTLRALFLYDKTIGCQLIAGPEQQMDVERIHTFHPLPSNVQQELRS